MNNKNCIVPVILSLLSLPVIASDLKPNDGLYNDNILKLEASSFADAQGSYSVEQCPKKTPNNKSILKGSPTALQETLWKIALDDMERNIIPHEKGAYFGAGTRYGTRIYTRDISFAGILGANDLYPQVMLTSLKITRELRMRMGFQVSAPHVVEEIKAPWQVIAETEKEVMAKYNSNCITRNTDDVIWVWAMHDLYTKNPKLAEWKWFYDTGKKFFDLNYAPWYDKSDGLYRGQAVFQDITHNGYPDGMSIQDCVLLKSSSTNALYYKALLCMADAARQAGESETAVRQWKEKAESLQLAFQKEFLMPDGRLSYYKDRYGRLMPNQHNLSTGLAALFKILTPEQAKKAYSLYPVTDRGVSLIHPYLADKLGSHNSASWPFCCTIFLWGKEITNGESQLDLNTALLARSLGTKLEERKVNKNKPVDPNNPEDADWDDGFGSFHEKIDHVTGVIGGSGHQLWSAAAYLNMFLRQDMVEIQP